MKLVLPYLGPFLNLFPLEHKEFNSDPRLGLGARGIKLSKAGGLYKDVLEGEFAGPKIKHYFVFF